MQLDQELLWLVGGIVGLLALSSAITFFLKRRPGGPNKVVANLDARVKAWWVMVAVFGVALATGGLYGYMQRASLPSLLAGIGFGAFYGYSAVLIGRGRGVDGVDLSVLASAALLLAVGPRAYRTRATVPVAMTAAGAAVLARMGYVSYCLRHP